MFDDYKEIDSTFEVTVADNGFVLKLSGRDATTEEWASPTFIFADLDGLSKAIDTLKELV